MLGEKKSYGPTIYLFFGQTVEIQKKNPHTKNAYLGYSAKVDIRMSGSPTEMRGGIKGDLKKGGDWVVQGMHYFQLRTIITHLKLNTQHGIQ